jgi:hypothetical protein
VVHPTSGDLLMEIRRFVLLILKMAILSRITSFTTMLEATAGSSVLRRTSVMSVQCVIFLASCTKDGDDESVKMAKELTARQRFFSPVIVRGEESLGVKVWGYGKMAYETLLSLVLNPDYGDITDIESGTDLDLNYGKAPGQSFPQTKLTPKRNTSPVCTDATPEECKEILDNVPDFSTLFEKKSTAEVQAFLSEHLSTDGSAESSSKETTKYNATGQQSVKEQFNDLLNA